jgi:CRISPR-associated endonuclease/helicase Cas3
MIYPDFFRTLTGFDPYAYQRRVAAILLGRSTALDAGLAEDVRTLEITSTEQLAQCGANVILQAPTGSGKTLASIVPFVFAGIQRFPIADRVIYALPLRSLAESLYKSTKDLLEKANLLNPFPVRLQTGETSGVSGVGDPNFAEGRIIFCTIDQVLSSYLNIPFSLSAGQANLNAGALIGSLLVFDEYHLLDPDRSLRTSLLLDQHLAGLTHFVWMTATQAGRARRRLSAPDRANAVSVHVLPEELGEIPSQMGKERRWIWHARALNPAAVWRAHLALAEGRRRTLVVLNTVSRSQETYAQIRALAPPTVPIRLLHSRFLSQDRADTQVAATEGLGRGSKAEMILIATQVVEAGLDLSADCLHTELAPANALVQRAGRCARFEGENGTVFIYDSLDADGVRSYAPYVSRGSATASNTGGNRPQIRTLRGAIDQTAIEVAELSGRSVSFQDELALIDRVHTDLDLAAIESFDTGEWRRRAADAMTPAQDYRNYAAAADLIRDVDSVSVFLADQEHLSDPSARLAPRYRPAAISIPRTSLAALSNAACAHAGVWAIQAPKYAEAERGDGYCGYEVIAEAGEDYRKWIMATYRSGPLAVNPMLGRYTPTLGLQLGICSQPGDWQSSGLLSADTVEQRGRADQRYKVETFEEHVNWVKLHANAICGDETARSYLANEWATRTGSVFLLTDQRVGLMRLDAQHHLPQGTSAELMVLAAALHDSGKLTASWQKAVWSWQTLKASRREHYPIGPTGTRLHQSALALQAEKDGGRQVLLAHTDFDYKWRWPDGRQENEIERDFPRPNHALEGAWLALPWVAGYVDRNGLPSEQLAKSVLAAIARHHSPRTGLAPVNRHRPIPLTTTAPGAEEALQSVVDGGSEVRLLDEHPSHREWEDFLVANVRFELKPGAGTSDDWTWWPMAMAMVRIVRLADQNATELAGFCQKREIT